MDWNVLGGRVGFVDWLESVRGDRMDPGSEAVSADGRLPPPGARRLKASQWRACVSYIDLCSRSRRRRRRRRIAIQSLFTLLRAFSVYTWRAHYTVITAALG